MFLPLISLLGQPLGASTASDNTREHIRYRMTSLHLAGNKPGTVHVRYRSVNRFFRWRVKEGEREDNPLDFIDPPKLPDVIQPFYQPHEVETL